MRTNSQESSINDQESSLTRSMSSKVSADVEFKLRTSKSIAGQSDSDIDSFDASPVSTRSFSTSIRDHLISNIQ